MQNRHFKSTVLPKLVFANVFAIMMAAYEKPESIDTRYEYATNTAGNTDISAQEQRNQIILASYPLTMKKVLRSKPVSIRYARHRYTNPPM